MQDSQPVGHPRVTRRANVVAANTYFLVLYAVLWTAILFYSRMLRFALDQLNPMYPYPVPQSEYQLEYKLQNYAVAVAWGMKIPTVVVARMKDMMRVYQPCLILDVFLTLNYSFQLMLVHEFPELTSNYLTSDSAVLSFAYTGMLLWQEAGISVFITRSRFLCLCLSTGIVTALSLGAWAVLQSNSVLDALAALVLCTSSVYATYVLLPQLIGFVRFNKS